MAVLANCAMAGQGGPSQRRCPKVGKTMRPEELDRFREALYQVSYGGGVGFCHDALPDLLPEGHHGPLVLALDSSILIDLQDHGNAFFNSDHPDVSDQ